jgi:hypothetical protein
MSSSGPLYPQKRTSVEPVGTSALCQKRTPASEAGVAKSPTGATIWRRER